MKPLRTVSRLAVLLIGAPLPAQQTVVELPPIGVTATRAPSTPRAPGIALTILSGDSARRGAVFVTLADLLLFVPGVFAADRGDATVDQRITVRGSGARANFGIRGLRILIDGIPATLPDGQSQLGALIPATIDRIEVGRGSLGAIHGNASAGVIALTTAGMPTRSALGGAVTVDDHGGIDALLRAATPLGERFSASFAFAATERDGPRDHAHSLDRNWNASMGWRVSPRTTVTLRGAWLDTPFNQSPGALTPAEFQSDIRHAAARNIRLDAGKSVTQRQLSLSVEHQSGPIAFAVRTWVVGRDLANPIAAPAPSDPSAGTWIELDRTVHGARFDAEWRATPTLAVSGGLDWQQMIDARTNSLHQGSGPVGLPFVDQEERVSEIGPFIQGSLRFSQFLSWHVSLRHDRTSFGVTDHLDVARSGERLMGATTAATSIGWVRGAWDGWIGYAGGFTTPTTTELANRSDGQTGLNSALDPERQTTIEVGIRRLTPRLRVEVAAWASRTVDAILPAREVDGRSIFHNVPRTIARGLDLTASARLGATLQAEATASFMDSRFGAGVRDGNDVPIGDRRIPGVPSLSTVVGIAWASGPWHLSLDHQFRSRTMADDQNRASADGWGGGLTNLRLGRRWQRVAVDLSARNLFDRALVSSVVVNAAAGRYIQPQDGRRVRIGMKVEM